VRTAAAVMTAFFVGCAALQLNDPDPAGWMAIYLATAAASALLLLKQARAALVVAVPVAAVAIIWGASLAPALGRTSLSDAFGHMGMVDMNAEEAREAIGLFITAVWAMVVGLSARRQT
jgi:hypothetical protein